MKPIATAFALLVFAKAVTAQSYNYTQQTKWKDNPDIHSVASDFAGNSAVSLLDDRTIEYKVEDRQLQFYTTYHRIYKINDDKGIEMLNKIYVPVYDGATISNLKARTILPNGRVINMPNDKVKETEEDGQRYKIFAMEGVEKGSEIEYQYTSKREPRFFGSEYFQNGSTPCQKALFTLSVPKHLKFDAKGFNGFKVSRDSVIGDQRVIVGYDENIPEIDDEKYAERNRYFKRVEYKFSYNMSSNPDTRLYTWKEFAKGAYATYTTLTAKEEKPLSTLLESTQAVAAGSEEAKIVAIENYIKTTINIDKDLIGEDASLIDKILKRKSADNIGIVRLFANLFEKAGVKYQIVFVSKRNETPFDEQLENWNKADDIAFYFPSTKKYLAPTSVEYRYPFLPYYWTGSKGLFLKATTIGSFTSAIGSFAEVEMLPFENHAHDMEASVKLSKGMDSLIIHSRQILYGYGAAGYRPIYTFLTKDKQDEATLEIVKSVAQSNDIKNIQVENSALTDMNTNKPLIISADIKSSDLIERAGDKILVKFGELIGPQEQMYQEKPRKLPVEMPYPHRLKRTLTFDIPTGYKVKNLNDLNISIEHKEGGDVSMGFTSSYKVSGNSVTVDVMETYKHFYYPLEQFEEFKKIINASADFNKIVLVLEKG